MSAKSAHYLRMLILLLAAFAAFGRAVGNGFVNFDDPSYVSGNPHVRAGLTLQGIRWAFTHAYYDYWHPLAWISHMLDVQLFGMWPGGHHLMSILMHAGSMLLLYALLARATGRGWLSFFAAALFGLHPLRVESVAWACERKDVLSTLLWMATTYFYVAYAQTRRGSDYLAACWCFALGLMAKPMLVTLPFTLLLLDFWPLGRTPWVRAARAGDIPSPGTPGEGEGGGHSEALAPETPTPTLPRSTGGGRNAHAQLFCLAWLVLEKLPFFALAAAGAVGTIAAAGRFLHSMEALPLSWRIVNAAHSYVAYIWMTIKPDRLAVYYPFRRTAEGMLAPYPLWIAVVIGIVLIGMSIVAAREWRRRPFLLVGWLWYLGTLVPVIGLLQVCDQAKADRFTYVPHVGLMVMLVWGAWELLRRWPKARLALAPVGVVAVIICIAMTIVQVGYWHDSISLFAHAVDVTPPNTIAENNLGLSLMNDEKLEEGLAHLKRAVEIASPYLLARCNYGKGLFIVGRRDEALEQYNYVLKMDPNNREAHNNLGNFYVAKDQYDQAIEQFRLAVESNPEKAAIPYANWGMALDHQGSYDEAMDKYRKALALDPLYVEAYHNYGVALAKAAKQAALVGDAARAAQLKSEAIEQFKTALRLNPGYAVAHFHLGEALETEGLLDRAAEHYREAIRLQPNYKAARDRLSRVENEMQVSSGGVRG